MSSDIQTLQALTKKTDHAMRYFELVTITNGSLQKKCFLGVGKHAVYFLRQNLGHGIYNDGAGSFLQYAFVLNLVKDKTSDRHFMLVLGSNRPPDWSSERLYIESEQREMLIRHLRNSWQTDYMWRLGKVAVLKISETKMRDAGHDGDELQMKAFEGYDWQRFQDYKFMVPNYFEPYERDGEWIYQASGTALVVHVHEPFTLDQLRTLGREHIRWVASEYIHNLLTEQDHFYITRNEPYIKRMNLAGDRASWYAWEIIIKTKEVTFLAMVLRRQYIPPICNMAQDIAILLRCPREKNQQILPHWQKELRLIANTLGADASTFTVYQDIVQAKLDALRYDEEATFWIGAYIKLYPKWRQQALIFLHKIMAMYIEDMAISDNESILRAENKKVLISESPGDEWASIDDSVELEQIIKRMKEETEGIPEKRDDPIHHALADADRKHNDQVTIQTNKWYARVARYFAWAVDGGLVGDLFTLDKMIDGLSQLTEENKKQANFALLFMLHIRERDMMKGWDATNLSMWLRKPERQDGEAVFSNRLPYDRPDLLKQATFNETVMQAFFRTEYVKKLHDDYYRCLGQFLAQDLGTQLKAFICRTLCQLEDSSKQITVETSRAIIQPLLGLLRDGSTLFLATYACAALVNMSHENENVKNVLIAQAAHKDSLKLLKSKDDDLLTYVLMLLVNLTKEPHTRAIIAEVGLLPQLYDVLTSSYHMCGPDFAKEAAANICQRKARLLTQVCIIIGQFCNEPNWRDKFQHKYEYTANCLIYIFLHAKVGSVLAQQSMFAMKQLCVNSAPRKGQIGDMIIPDLVVQLKNKEVDKPLGYLTQATLLLLALANHSKNKKKMEEEGLEDVLKELKDENRTVRTSDYLRQRLDTLIHMISHGL